MAKKAPLFTVWELEQGGTALPCSTAAEFRHGGWLKFLTAPPVSTNDRKSPVLILGLQINLREQAKSQIQKVQTMCLPPRGQGC